MTRPVRHQTFVGTIVQAAPRVRELLANMHPTWHLSSLDAINPTFLARHGVAGMIWDVDGTLTANRGTLAPHVAPAFDTLLAHPGLRHAILSNADEERFLELGRIFPAIPIIRGYRTGDDPAPTFRRLIGTSEEWSTDEPPAGGDTIALRKPSAALVHEAVRVLGLEPRAVVMIGDQYLTDVAGANLAGVRSIKVPTFARSTFPVPVQTAQWLESIIHRLLHGRSEALS